MSEPVATVLGSEIDVWLNGDKGMMVFVPRELSLKLLAEVAAPSGPGDGFRTLRDNLIARLAKAVAEEEVAVEGEPEVYSEDEMRSVLTVLAKLVYVHEAEQESQLAEALKSARGIVMQAKAKGLLP